ncbi:hypothetical protein [Limnospira platensis]|uniref:hypothetical protein n=1 Tax=Limnospira platensis TaxID=118562 RepID=UPI000686E9CA|nr:hypothetical protein APLC1_1627 [Arthrospira platensis C1]
MKYLTIDRNHGNFFKIYLSVLFTWLLLPFVIVFDLLIIEPYHQICFRLNGMELVKRSDYIQVVDRTKLKYLRWYEKLGCAYCGYVNGLMFYAKVIVNRSEKHWCGIRHQKKKGFKNLEHQEEQDFAEYGNEKEYQEKYNQHKS